MDTVCHFEAPKANEASRSALGQLRMASSATVTIVGRAMMAKTMLPASPLSPTGRPNTCCSRGTMMIRPKKAVDHRRDAVEQLDDGLEDIPHPLRGHLGHIDRYADAERQGKTGLQRNSPKVYRPAGATYRNRGAGVAVGNHSLPANTSFGEMLLSSMKLSCAPSSTMLSGIKAIIPGVAAIRESIFPRRVHILRSEFILGKIFVRILQTEGYYLHFRTARARSSP